MLMSAYLLLCAADFTCFRTAVNGTLRDTLFLDEDEEGLRGKVKEGFADVLKDRLYLWS